MIGKRLGGYRVDAELGQGGMGVVYRATQVDLDRPVALKLLPPQFTIDPAFIQRFRREARAIAQLNHPNIVQIYDIGVDHSTHFYAMEYVEGDTLDEHIFRDYRLKPKDAVRIIVQVCRALQAAHDAGIIHRDIKPANIIIDKQGRTKLMDFGIALSLSSARLTATGGIIGTPEYMSPEQAGGGEIGPQSDIYSLGIVFYEMVTGQVPFENPESMKTLQQQQFEEPRPPGQLNSDVPLALEQIILKMLAKAPERRYQSCAELVHDLRALTQGTPENSSATGIHDTGAPGMPHTGPRRSPVWAVAAVAFSAAAVAAVAVMLLSVRTGPPPEDPTPPPETVAQYAGTSEVLAGLVEVYAQHAEALRERDRVVVHLRNGGVLHVAAADVDMDTGVGVLTVPAVGTFRVPMAALDADEPVSPGADPSPPDAAEARRAARQWARDALETWKVNHLVDHVLVADLPALLHEAESLLPPVPPVPHARELAAVAEADARRTEADAVLAAAEEALAAARAGSADTALRFADRVVLHTGREIPCRILDRESDGENLVVALSNGGRMTIRFADVRYWDRAYGQAAAAAARAQAETAATERQIAAVRKRVESATAARQRADAEYLAAVDALLAAAVPPEDGPGETGTASAPLTPEAAPGPAVHWEETFADATFFMEDTWNEWHVAQECGGLSVRFDAAALVLATDTDLPWSGCAPHVYRAGLAVADTASVELAVNLQVPEQEPSGVLACWVEVEGRGVPPLAYLLYASNPLAALPAGQAQQVALIRRPGLYVAPDMEWYPVSLPVGADWAESGQGHVTVTGLRLVHHRSGATGDGRFVTRFDDIKLLGAQP